ncbi:MAG: NUDIX family hydrolase [Chloroflexi bacterium OLB14]|nr:MAG: NUDIX family hydrolase [Chloroflexi bacterium OLB14]
MEEFLDIVNQQDIVIGKEFRTKVHEIGLWHRGVHVFLFNQQGEMLIQKRSADRASNPLKLDCSVSEHVQAGESYLDAAIRGMKEELGLENIQIKKVAKFRMNYGVNDNEISELYEGIVEATQVKFDTVEIDSIFYLSMNTLQKMLKENEKEFCGWFIELLKLYWGDNNVNMEIMTQGWG